MILILYIMHMVDVVLSSYINELFTGRIQTSVIFFNKWSKISAFAGLDPNANLCNV